jgi:hypothetical protein
MEENLTRTRLGTRFLYEMDFVSWIVEGGNICLRRWLFSLLQHSELWMIQNFARVVDLRVTDRFCRHPSLQYKLRGGFKIRGEDAKKIAG